MPNNTPKITMYSTSWCADCTRAKKFFADKNITYTEIDIEKNPKAVEIVEKYNNGNHTVPTILIGDIKKPDNILTEPSWQELEKVF